MDPVDPVDPDDLDDERLSHVEDLLAEAGALERAEPLIVPPFDPTRCTRVSMRRRYCRRPIT